MLAVGFFLVIRVLMKMVHTMNKTFLRTLLFCVAVMVFGFGALGMPTVSLAQSSADVRRIDQNITSIARQLRALQETVLKHMEANEPTGTAPVSQVAGETASKGDSTILADIEVRLGALDREFRTLTGRIEEMDYRQRQLENQFANLKADTELRFQDLSAGAAVAPTGGKSVSDQTESTNNAPAQLIEKPKKTVEAVVEKQRSPTEAYEQAFGFLRRGDFKGAEGEFKSFLVKNPDHELAGNAQYWLGESYYARRDYTNAAAMFLTGYQKYRSGSKANDSLLKLGMSLASMGQKEEACIVFKDLRIQHSDAQKTILESAKREAERNNCNS